MQQDSAKLSLKLETFMRENRYTQTYVAEQAEVDQATVSRFLKKPPQRATLANQRLCNYAESLHAAKQARSPAHIAAQKSTRERFQRYSMHWRNFARAMAMKRWHLVDRV
jgi:DNA-binding LacI/PurR family transcriptional regulator